MSDELIPLIVSCVDFHFFILFMTDMCINLVENLGLVRVNVLDRLKHEGLCTGFEASFPQLLD
jgi:hypothetical protein